MAVAPDPEEQLEESKRALFENVAVAREMTPEEREAEELARQSRKKIYVGGGEGDSGWQDQERGGASGGFSWKIWVSGIAVIALITAFGIRYIVELRPSSESENKVVSSDEFEARLENFRPEEEVLPVPKDDEVVALIDSYQEIEGAIKGFLSAETIEEKKKFVRSVERVGPLMDLHYGKSDYEAEGFESLSRDQITERNDNVITLVQTGDFVSQRITAQRPKKEGDGYLVDWESWVGYSDFTPEEMRSKKPTQPFLVRAHLRVSDYYNYGFSDDSKWQSYGLDVGEEGYRFLGYVVKGQGMHNQLIQILKDSGHSKRLVLKVAYLKGSRAKDQVEIVEIIPSDDWVLSEDKPNK